MFDDFRRDIGVPTATELLKNRPKIEKARRERSAMLHEHLYRTVKGNYVCEACGFCTMHHEGPVCEGATWVKGWGCRMCPGPLRLEMNRTRWTFDQGRYHGLSAGNGFSR